MKKNLIHFFAVIGFGTFILLACSVDDIADSMNNNNNSEIVSTACEVDVSLQNSYGKYQVSTTESYGIVVLNTETGVMKTYRMNAGWEEYPNVPDITFTH
tara:strand:+ start:185 stop:484 length:300 start_codon:yes stop_codon:yes gene_type:complete